MEKYLGIINLPYGDRKYVKFFDRETNKIATTSSVKDAILLDDKDKPSVRYGLRKLFPSYSFSFPKLSKFDGFFEPITSKIDEIYPNHQYDCGSMLDWKHGTLESEIMAKEIAKKEDTPNFTTFVEFAEYVANVIGGKHNLKKEGET